MSDTHILASVSHEPVEVAGRHKTRLVGRCSCGANVGHASKEWGIYILFGKHKAIAKLREAPVAERMEAMGMQVATDDNDIEWRYHEHEGDRKGGFVSPRTTGYPEGVPVWIERAT